VTLEQKVARLARSQLKAALPIPATERASQRATIEAKGCEVVGWQGDHRLFTMIAPSRAAALVCAKALRVMQDQRGHVF
jgi:hypothetical protein